MPSFKENSKFTPIFSQNHLPIRRSPGDNVPASLRKMEVCVQSLDFEGIQIILWQLTSIYHRLFERFLMGQYQYDGYCLYLEKKRRLVWYYYCIG